MGYADGFESVAGAEDAVDVCRMELESFLEVEICYA